MPLVTSHNRLKTIRKVETFSNKLKRRPNKDMLRNKPVSSMLNQLSQWIRKGFQSKTPF